MVQRGFVVGIEPLREINMGKVQVNDGILAYTSEASGGNLLEPGWLAQCGARAFGCGLVAESKR